MTTLKLSFGNLDPKSGNLDPESLHRIAQDTCNRISDAGLAESSLEETVDIADESGVKKKGVTLALGTIVLALIKSGAVTALINLLRPVFDSTADLVAEVKAADGRTVRIDAKRLRPDQVKALTDEVAALVR